MKRTVIAWLLALCVMLSVLGGATACAEEAAVDTTATCRFSLADATVKKTNGDLVITAAKAGAEAALVFDAPINLNDYPYWKGVIRSDVPFDIAFYDKNHTNQWMFAAADFCYAFAQNDGASSPIPAGTHDVVLPITNAYTWNGDSLPAGASIYSVTFIAKAAGTITVSSADFVKTETAVSAPDTVYFKDGTLLKAIPTCQAAATLCKDIRHQFDATKASVNNADGTTLAGADYVGTGDVITLTNGTATQTLTAVVRGDTNGDGETTTADVRALLQHITGSATLDAAQLAASDMRTDEQIATIDARYMLMDILLGTSMTFSQQSVVAEETFTSQSTFKTFLSSASRDALLAGLTSDLVPQGMAQNHQNGLTYVSAYSSSGGGSCITVYDSIGRFTAEYMLYNADGTPCTGHLGGLAVSGDTLFASYDGGGKYRVAAFPLGNLVTKGSQELVITTWYEVPVSTSFLSYYDGYLWMGNFYLPSSGYGLMRELNTELTFGGASYGCYIAGFDLSKQGNARLLPEGSNRYATPDVVFAAGQKVQGMAYDTVSKTVILSHSWGRKNNSKLAMYTVDLSKTADTTVTLNGKKVPCFVLASPKKEITTMPMTEGITLDGNGGVRVLYESGANKYSDGTYRTDHIWNYQYR